jgi:hypothetical protein
MNDNEIQFMKYFERVMLPNKRKITKDMIQEGERIAGIRVLNPSCTNCLHAAAVDLLNLYNRNLPAWQEFQKRLKELELTQNVEKYTSFKPEPEEEKPFVPEPRKNLKNIDKTNENKKTSGKGKV